MNSNQHKLIVVIRLIVLLTVLQIPHKASFAQQKNLSWDELQQVYQFPKWYTEARFGIWCHWGAQSEPDSGGGWYARHMYMQNVEKETWGKNAYQYQINHFGHPSEKGFKDVINAWKAEDLNTDSLLGYFKSIGAKFFVALANHHDHFDNFASTYHQWNSVNVGPHKDIIGLFSKSAKKYHIPFGVSSHDDRFLTWWLPAFGADTSGQYKGIPYDGRLTKADGKGQWWDGLDPADLYGLPPEKRTPEYIESVKKNYVQRIEELVTKYNVDMLWVDGYGFPYGKYGKEVFTYFMNHNLQEHGKFTAVLAGKFQGKEPGIVEDIERGGATEILSYPWEGTLTFTDWFLKKDVPIKHNARTVIESLTDIISKNGNLLLNVELTAAGTIPPEHKKILDTVGAWIISDSIAIYASKPWKIYGDNIGGTKAEKNISETDLANAKKQSNDFNERTVAAPPYPHSEVRFTTRDKNLYIFVLNPVKGVIEIPSLGWESPYNSKKIISIKLLGSNDKIDFKQDDNKLVLTIPSNLKDNYTKVFEVKGLL